MFAGCSQRKWLVCKWFCKLCCLSWWLFVPVLVMILVDGKCQWVDGVKDDGSGELACMLCNTNVAPFYFDGE
eukprot:SAG22_NODE_1848_length_3446_cov_4.797132_3_plen_72_part_00